MAEAWQIEDWQRERESLTRQLEMLRAGKMGSGRKALHETTSATIKRVSDHIAELDALIAGSA